MISSLFQAIIPYNYLGANRVYSKVLSWPSFYSNLKLCKSKGFDGDGYGALLPFFYLKFYPLAVLEGTEHLRLDATMVNEYIFISNVRSDESITFAIVEPLDGTFQGFLSLGIS